MSDITPTDGDWLDSDALLEMCIGSIISLFGAEDSLSAESIHECCSTCVQISLVSSMKVECRLTSTTCTTYHHRELDSLFDVFLLADLRL